MRASLFLALTGLLASCGIPSQKQSTDLRSKSGKPIEQADAIGSSERNRSSSESPSNKNLKSDEYAKEVVHKEKMDSGRIPYLEDTLTDLGVPVPTDDLKKFTGDFYLNNISRRIGEEHLILSFNCVSGIFADDTLCGVKEVPANWHFKTMNPDSNRAPAAIKLSGKEPIKMKFADLNMKKRDGGFDLKVPLTTLGLSSSPSPLKNLYLAASYKDKAALNIAALNNLLPTKAVSIALPSPSVPNYTAWTFDAPIPPSKQSSADPQFGTGPKANFDQVTLDKGVLGAGLRFNGEQSQVKFASSLFIPGLNRLTLYVKVDHLNRSQLIMSEGQLSNT